MSSNHPPPHLVQNRIQQIGLEHLNKAWKNNERDEETWPLQQKHDNTGTTTTGVVTDGASDSFIETKAETTITTESTTSDWFSWPPLRGWALCSGDWDCTIKAKPKNADSGDSPTNENDKNCDHQYVCPTGSCPVMSSSKRKPSPKTWTSCASSMVIQGRCPGRRTRTSLKWNMRRVESVGYCSNMFCY